MSILLSLSLLILILLLILLFGMDTLARYVSVYFLHPFCTCCLALRLALPSRCDSISGQSKGFAFSTHSHDRPLLVSPSNPPPLHHHHRHYHHNHCCRHVLLSPILPLPRPDLVNKLYLFPPRCLFFSKSGLVTLYKIFPLILDLVF